MAVSGFHSVTSPVAGSVRSTWFLGSVPFSARTALLLLPLTLSDPEDCRTQAPLSSTISWSLLKFMSMEAVIGFKKFFIWGKRVLRLKTGNHSCPVA